MKKVFSSNGQLTHVWAQLTQEEGRGNNMFFQGPKIYSYGYHFLAAQIHEVKGKRFCLIQQDRYSPSTGKHLNYIWNAVNGLMPYFYVSNPADLKQAVKDLDAAAERSLNAALKRIKIESKADIKSEFETIRAAFAHANELRKLLGRAEKHPQKKQLDQVEEHLEFRLQRYKELNTPEMIAKRDAEREKREARKAKQLQVKLAEEIANWKAGVFTYVNSLNKLPHELLRIRGNEVQTSRGANVPLREATILYKALESGKDVLGLKVGDFTVVNVTNFTNGDKAIKIGCHNILLSEARSVLGNNVLNFQKGA